MTVKELGQENLDKVDLNEKTLTEESVKAIENLILLQKGLKITQKEYNENLTACAEKLGIKPAVLKSRIGVIIKEEEKGGAIKEKTKDIEFTEKFFIIKNNK